MDFNKIAEEVILELKTHAKRTDKEIAERIGISRQAYIRRRDTNSLTTENLTSLAIWSIVGFGGGWWIDKYWREQRYDTKLTTKER